MTKKKDETDTTTTETPNASPSEETAAAQAADHDAAQQKEMDDLLTDFDDSGQAQTKESEKKTDQPAEKKPPETDTPDKKTPDTEKAAPSADGAADGKEKKPAEKKPAEKKPAEKKPAEEKKQAAEKKTKEEEEGKTKTPDKDDPFYEIESVDGVRMVPLSSLKTTYQQFANLQRTHELVKPIMDLAKETQTPLPALYPFLRFGIEQAVKAQAAAAGEEKPAAGAYDGPFQDQEEEDYIKQSDPTLYNTAKRIHEQGRNVNKALAAIQAAIARGAVFGAPAPDRERQKPRDHFDNELKTLQETHKDAFASANSLESFKKFLFARFTQYPMSAVNKEFLETVLAQYNPQYWDKHLLEKAQTLAHERKEQEHAAFGETGNVRDTHIKPKLTEQQEHMTDLLENP